MVEQVMSNLYKIEIPLPQNPLKAINCYVVTGADRNLIIDTGMNRPECLNAMTNGLAEIGVDLSRTDFVITHLHVDHSGLAATMVADGCKVYASRHDGLVVNTFSGMDSSRHWNPMKGYAAAHGFPQDLLTIAIERHPAYLYRPKGPVNFTILAEGEVVSAGGYNFRCIDTPGHTRGHLCLYEAEKKVLISGDHILGDITPNISQWLEEEEALATYFSSLDKISQIEVDLVLPGHRKIFPNCGERIRQLKEHHSHRLQEIRHILQDKGPLNAYEVAALMTWEMRGQWGDFPVQQKWFAHGEAIAHLKYLEKRGEAVSKKNEDPTTFTVL